MIPNQSTTTLLDPTGEHQVTQRKRAARPDALTCQTIALLDIGKARGNIFLDRLAERLGESGIAVKRYAKPTPSRLATLDTRQAIAAETGAAVIGLAD